MNPNYKRRSSRNILLIVLIIGILVVSAYLAVSAFSGIQSAKHSKITGKTGVLIPLYTYPTDPSWAQVIKAKESYPAVPFVVIINPDSGPGNMSDLNYRQGITQLQQVNITVLGYVATGYGATPLQSVKSQILEYSEWYRVQGVFLDEMAHVTGYEDYYSNITGYTKSLGMTVVVGNPGTSIFQSYYRTVDSLVIYENLGYPNVTSLRTSLPGSYNKSNFAMIVIGAGTPSIAYLAEAAKYLGYIYITNANLPNPFNSLTPYLSDMLSVMNKSDT